VLGYHRPVSLKSKPTPVNDPRVCGIADALGIVGDRWALLVLRELGFGVHRFNDIQVNTGAPRDSLATRLRQLEEAGLITRRRYSEHPPRDEYLLTDAGAALGPALNELRIWGETYARPVARGADSAPVPPGESGGAAR
jgi:DNA-binding HxlR family transcriptional regulator